MPSTNGHGSKPERVALYLRVSSEEQRDRETIELQRDFLEQYRSLMELEVADVYKDDGISGTTPLHERPEGRRLLEDAREGKFGTVLVYKLDRLGRSLLVIVDAHDRLQGAGVALRSATEPIDTSTPSGRLIFQMLASFAEYDRGTIRERTQAGLHRAYRNGRHMGPVPFGYRASPKDRRLEVVEEEAEVVRQIFANIAGGSTLYAEAKRLNTLGIQPPSWKYASTKTPATKWREPTLRLIARQTAYSGVHEVKLSTGEVVKQKVPQIVAPELQQRALAPQVPLDRAYLLRGL
jgi:site-specific DNA recombinase